MPTGNLIRRGGQRAAGSAKGALASIRSAMKGLWERIPVVGSTLAQPVVAGLSLGTVILLGYGAYRLLM